MLLGSVPDIPVYVETANVAAPTQTSHARKAGGAHVAIVTIPEHGHVLPTLALVSELVRRGHRVTYIVSSDFVDAVREAGATRIVPLIGKLPEGAIPEGDMEAGVSFLVNAAARLVPQLHAVFAADRPDVVVHDLLAWSGKMLAAHLGVPAVQLNCSHAPYKSWEREMCGVASLQDAAFFDDFRRFLHANGIDSSTESFISNSDYSVVFTVKRFQRMSHTVSDSHTFVGPSLGERRFQGQWHRVSDRPLLFVSMGSCFSGSTDFINACVEAFELPDWDVVMAVGNRADLSGMHRVPPKNVSLRRHVPQLKVLAQADAFISHGGMGSTMEAMYYGVPLVVIPQMSEQRINATQVQELNLGRCVPSADATASEMRRVFMSVVGDKALKSRVEEMQREVQGAGGAQAAADVVDRALGDYSLLS